MSKEINAFVDVYVILYIQLDSDHKITCYINNAGNERRRHEDAFNSMYLYAVI